MPGILSKNIFYSSDLVSPSPPSLAGVSELTSDSASPSAAKYCRAGDSSKASPVPDSRKLS